MSENEISGIVLDRSIRVHKRLGPGLLESAYEACLLYELEQLGLRVRRQKPIPLVYNDVKLDCGYRCDMMVEEKVIIEIKSIEAIDDLHLAQVLTYLKLTNCKLGLIINFNVEILKNGYRRVVLNL